MDFKSLINKLDSLETPATVQRAQAAPASVQLSENAQLRVLAGTSTIAHETALLEACSPDKSSKGKQSATVKESDMPPPLPKKKGKAPMAVKESDMPPPLPKKKGKVKSSAIEESSDEMPPPLPKKKGKVKSSTIEESDQSEWFDKIKDKNDSKPAVKKSVNKKDADADEDTDEDDEKDSQKNEGVTSFTSRFLKMVESKKDISANNQTKKVKSQAAEIAKLKKQVATLKDKKVTESRTTLESRLRSHQSNQYISESDHGIDAQATRRFGEKLVQKLDKVFSQGMNKMSQDANGYVTINVNDGWLVPNDHPEARTNGVASAINVDKLIDPYFYAFRQNGDYFGQRMGSKFTFGIKDGSKAQYESITRKGRRIAEGRDHNGNRLSFKQLVKLVQESGGQQRIDPVDTELFNWANRVAVNKLGEGTRAELYAGTIYERMGGIFEMHDILSESGYDDFSNHTDDVGRGTGFDKSPSARMQSKRPIRSMKDLGRSDFDDETDDMHHDSMSGMNSMRRDSMSGMDDMDDMGFIDDEFVDSDLHDFRDNRFGNDRFNDDEFPLMRESTASDITNTFNSMVGGIDTGSIARVAILAMQGRHTEAAKIASVLIKKVDDSTRQKIIDKINNIKPVTINGKIASSSELDKSTPHQDWIYNTFVPWFESLVSSQSTDSNTSNNSNTSNGSNNLKQIASLVLQGESSRAMRYLTPLMKNLDPDSQDHISDKLDKVQPAMINGKLATASEIEDSEKYQDWINNKFIPWIKSRLK